jgi:hypothetical protein
MKQFLIILAIISFGCTGNVNKNNQINPFAINQKLPSGKSFYIKDSTQYSPEFIEELKTLDPEYDSIKLIENNLIINKSDTFSIPIDLPLNKSIKYNASKGNNDFILTLERLNYTTIKYDFFINNTLVKTGQVLLSAGFFLGSEISMDENTSAFGSTQYFNKGNYSTCIKIENGNAERVEFYLHNDSDSTMRFENLPIFKKL